jgi:hypothetical protein
MNSICMVGCAEPGLGTHVVDGADNESSAAGGAMPVPCEVSDTRSFGNDQIHIGDGGNIGKDLCSQASGVVVKPLDVQGYDVQLAIGDVMICGGGIMCSNLSMSCNKGANLVNSESGVVDTVLDTNPGEVNGGQHFLGGNVQGIGTSNTVGCQSFIPRERDSACADGRWVVGCDPAGSGNIRHDLTNIVGLYGEPSGGARRVVANDTLCFGDQIGNNGNLTCGAFVELLVYWMKSRNVVDTGWMDDTCKSYAFECQNLVGVG